MKHTVVTKADLKAKSEELQILFSNLLAGFVLEELMYLISDSVFANHLWLKNGNIFGVRQYREKNVLTLDFTYITDEKVMKRDAFLPGQCLSLKMGYIMLAHFLDKEKVPEIKWRGCAEEKNSVVEMEITGEYEEMTVPIHVKITQMSADSLRPHKKKLPLFMEANREIEYLQYPVEIILAEQIFIILKTMELIPKMSAYDYVYEILSNEPVDGRHIREMLFQMCKNEHLVPEEERLTEILGYINYTYMRKRWEKYLRRRKRKEPSWDEVMEKMEKFLPPIWTAVCRDEVFFGDWMPGLSRFLD